MDTRIARAQVEPVRQRTQYTCMSTSMMMCLQALGYDVTEDEVNKVMGARPMKGAAWEDALACAQHFGCRATLTMPTTILQLKAWTDAGTAVMIAWNPEGRDWSHASTVYHVAEGPPATLAEGETLEGEGPGLYVWVADPNIPNPSKTTRIVHEDLFYKKWFEKWPNYLVRRPACAIEREITVTGRQVVASTRRVAEAADCVKDYRGGGLTWEEYQDCLKRVKEPGGYGRGRAPSGPSTSKMPVPPDFSTRAKRLLLALWFDGDARAKKFVQDNQYKTELSDKQLSWFESLERKHGAVIRDMPAKPSVSFGTSGGLFMHADRISDSERAKLERHFDIVPWRGPEVELRPKSRAAPTSPAPAGPSAGPGRHTFDRARTESMLRILDDLIAKTNMGMLRGFKQDLMSGKGLTENQLKAMRQQLYRSRMKPEADLFRVAAGSKTTFDWRGFGQELRLALARTPVPPHKVTGEEYPGDGVSIALQFGWDYYEKPDWDYDLVYNVIHRVAKKHGLRETNENGIVFIAPDGTEIGVGVMAQSSGGSPTRLASMMRHCEIYQASNGKWYLELADQEYGQEHDSTAYGPFPSERAAEAYIDNFSNPGGWGVDDSGNRNPPTRSPNGRPVVKPQSRPRWATVADRYLNGAS